MRKRILPASGIMSVICMLIYMVVCVAPATAATTLSTGDIAIIGMRGDATDDFSWVPLVDISAGEEIYFTDVGYFTTPDPDDFSSSPGTTDILLLYTAPVGGVSAGVVQTVAAGGVGGGTDYAIVQATGWGQTTAPTNLDIRAAGDSIYAFQSSTSVASASFGRADDANAVGLFAVTGSTTDWTASTATTLASETNLYPDLTDGTNAVAAGAGTGASDEFDNIRYTGTTTGTAAELLAAIANNANWEGQNTTPGSADYSRNGVTNFTVNAVPEPSTIAFVAGFGICVFALRRRKAHS